MSIATQQGDHGQTGLIGGARVSKADLRVEAYGTVDELGATLAFARSLCPNADIRTWTEDVQRTLFRMGGSLASPPVIAARAPVITQTDVDALTALVTRIEATPGILTDWSLPGANAPAAAYEIARTVCRRAERAIVRFTETGAAVEAHILPYTNRLSDLLWLFGRLLELEAGVDSRLRDEAHKGPNFSRAW